ncbi:GNAT family N-acetyltransferase [uncultured Paracoccus sp.]|uniref:GNAT family N-acetyltransferase n=1 Tax=uncultured Paracoccus sp. TaxID=189685 RepID=UPI002599EFB8|nr:GNAT family N-acetyltransferase [uncultured Paracoccus sp.]
MRLQHYETGEFTWLEGDFVISTERHRIDLAALVALYRAEAYWGGALEAGRFLCAVESSLPIGAYTTGGAIAGFCRVVTDGAMFAYLRDVLILPEHRGKGLGLALCQRALEHPDLARVNNWLLRTKDAQTLYARYGFTPVEKGEGYMRRQTAPVEWP